MKGRFLTVALIASFLAANVAVAATNPPAQHHSKKGTHPGHHGAKKHPQQHSGAHKKGSKPHTGQ